MRMYKVSPVSADSPLPEKHYNVIILQSSNLYSCLPCRQISKKTEPRFIPRTHMQFVIISS
jgi:hypothetical protein